MPRKTPTLQIESVPGDQYPNIEAAWQAALPTFADDLTATIRRLVAEGYFIVKDGKMIPNPERIRGNELQKATQ